MYCPNCQKEIIAASNYCYNCGARQPGAVPPNYAYPVKKLVRSTTDRKIAGVCAGLADYMDVDPTLIRLATLVVFFCGGFGLIPYIILWIALPQGPTGRIYESPVPAASTTPTT